MILAKEVTMGTQPEVIIQRIAADPSRLAKEAILEQAMVEGHDEFFNGLSMALDKLYTFGVKQVPISESDGAGLSWDNFKQLSTALYRREITGHDARDAIKLAMDSATKDQWNFWYRLILVKDMRAGFGEKSVNTVAKKLKNLKYAVPVFECMLARDGANHEAKIAGKKLLERKLDGVRAVTVIDFESRTVTMYTRNGKVLENFGHITSKLEAQIDNFQRSYVLDGEVVSSSFQDLMKEVHRKKDAQAQDAKLMLFDIIPLEEFKQGKSSLDQHNRTKFLRNFENIFNGTGCIELVPQIAVNLDELQGMNDYKAYNKAMVDAGYEGIMIKSPDAKYETKRSASWLKQKPFIEVSLTVTAVEEGTGRNVGKLGAFVCAGTDNGKDICVNVGSGFSDANRDEYWAGQDSIINQIVEVRADAVTQNQDGTYSLRFPRFLRFRGFIAGEKL